jgi:RING-box protein 2
MADEEEMVVDKETIGETVDESVAKKTKELVENNNVVEANGQSDGPTKLFTLKKWNAVSMWSWDVECDTCAICRVHVMDACLRCQADNKQDDCVVVWGECNHSFHNCCMSLWVQQNNRCPLCQQDWVVQRIGK